MSTTRALDGGGTGATRRSDSLVTDRMIAELSGAFGMLAVVLVRIGLYGVMAYATSGRTTEIGIHIALGAQHSGILWLVLRESLLLVLIGAAIRVPLVFTGREVDFQPALRLASSRSSRPDLRDWTDVRRRRAGQLHPGPPRHLRQPDDRPAPGVACEL